MNELNLWSARGTPHPIIIARLAERTDDECFRAYGILCGMGAPPTGVLRQMIERAETTRNTAEVLAVIEPHFRSAMEAINVAPDLREQALELHALAVEGCVRAANRVFPINARN